LLMQAATEKGPLTGSGERLFRTNIRAAFGRSMPHPMRTRHVHAS
jgi:hypothetical protein